MYIGIVLQLDAPIAEGADRWHCTRETGEQEYAFGEHAMGILIAHCRTREVSWQEDVVANRDTYSEHELQIKVRMCRDHGVCRVPPWGLRGQHVTPRSTSTS